MSGWEVYKTIWGCRDWYFADAFHKGRDYHNHNILFSTSDKTLIFSCRFCRVRAATHRLEIHVMGVEFAVIRATGMLIDSSKIGKCKSLYDEYRGNGDDFLAFDQGQYAYAEASILFCHYTQEDCLFDRKVGMTPFSFMDGGPYPVKDNYHLKGGASVPFVVILNDFGVEKWPWFELMTSQDEDLAHTLKKEGRYVECLFSYFH